MTSSHNFSISIASSIFTSEENSKLCITLKFGQVHDAKNVLYKISKKILSCLFKLLFLLYNSKNFSFVLIIFSLLSLCKSSIISKHLSFIFSFFLNKSFILLSKFLIY